MDVNYISGWVGGWSDKIKVILNSTQFKFKLVEVGDELGNYATRLINRRAIKCKSN